MSGPVVTPHRSDRHERALWRHGVVAGLYTVGSLMPLFLFGANAVRIQAELGFGTTELGYATSAFFAAGALGAPKLGRFIDRVGIRRALRIGMTLSGSAAFVVAFIARSWWIGAAGLALCGVSHALTQLSMNRMLVDGGSTADGALGFGMKQGAVPVVSLIAGLATAALVPSLPWQTLYFVAGSVSIALAISLPGAHEASSETKVGSASAGPYLRRLALGGSFAAGAGNALSLLIVDSFDASGFSDTTGAVVLGMGSGLAAVSRLGGGWVVDHRRSSGVPELRALLLVGSLGFGLLAISSGSLGLLSIGALAAFVGGWGWQGIVFYSATRDRRVLPATASGVVLAGTMSGSIIGPIVIGVTADRASYAVAWALAALALIVSAIAMPRSGPTAPSGAELRTM